MKKQTFFVYRFFTSNSTPSFFENFMKKLKIPILVSDSSHKFKIPFSN